ncbi:MFS transporter [Lentzea tibetensis]|uniref:MFS transporter n=1 Tax=Lentzea tibetensis TaxID=2591470 RepID=A0A563EP88_9PSEU|nr:MFS transporter [Lentzea tibetensis]TWP49111.1 MFS transporter [Lentzea tibetensis]
MALRGHADFTRLWTGDTISQFGAILGYTVFPLLAASLLHASPFEMGLLEAALMGAFLIIGLPAGVWVDRMRRRPLMIAMDLTRAALVLTVPVAWWLGVLTLAHLIVMALLLGVCTVFFDVAYQSYLPSLVGREHLVEGNSKLQASASVAEVTGPGLGGFAVQFLGAANAVLATGIGYLSSAFFLFRIRAEEPRPERRESPNLVREVMEGLRFVFHNRTLRAIVGCTGTANLFNGVRMAVMVLFLVRTLELSAAHAGLVFSFGGLGGVLGAATANRMQKWFGQARLIWLSMVVTAPFLLLTPLAAPGWRMAFALASVFGFGYGVIIYNIAQVSYRQTICPDHLLGRMNASIRWVVWGSQPVGALIGGLLGEWIGIVGTLWVSAIGGSLAGLFVVLSPLRTMRDLPANV